MDWQQGSGSDKHIQFIPAEKGWLALFEEGTDEGLRVHADPVIAWCLGAQEIDDGHHVISYGQPVIGASPWLDKADREDSSHFFALIREEQLDPEFVLELKRGVHHSREEIMALAEQNHSDRLQGHESWRRRHRVEKSRKRPPTPTRIF